MKKIIKVFLFSSVTASVIVVSCSKEEVVNNGTTQKAFAETAVNHYSVNPPYDKGEPGKEPAIHLQPPAGLDSMVTEPKYPYIIIETPTTSYINETCLLDISKLETHKTYHAIQNGKFLISFNYDSVLKLDSGPTGWNSKWGSAPYVECENPDVLYMPTTYTVATVIYLSEPCIEFGFELAPNHQDYDHGFGAIFGNDFIDYSEGFTSSVMRSPSGARLLAIKATHPFTQISVMINDSPTGDIPAKGVAFANIRYRLAK